MNHLIPNPALFGMAYKFQDFHGMSYRNLGKSGLRVSTVGIGTWKYGLPETHDGSRLDEKEAFAIFDLAWEKGVTFWDTANRYNESSGNSERVIGRWLQRHPDRRRDIVLATKLCGAMDGCTPNHCGLSRGNIMESVEASLARLQVSHIDLLYFHAWDEADPEEALSAIEDLVRMDKVRYFAVSNFTPAQLALYESKRETVRSRICAVQNQFSILFGERPGEEGTLAYCAEHEISYIAHSPFAQGLLTGRYNDPAKVGAGDRLYDTGDNRYQNPEVTEKLRALSRVAEDAGLSMSQLTLAYMLTMPGMGPVIPGASRVAQLEDNLQAAFITLTPAQIAAVREIVGR